MFSAFTSLMRTLFRAIEHYVTAFANIGKVAERYSDVYVAEAEQELALQAKGFKAQLAAPTKAKK